MSTKSNWLNVPPLEQREWLASETTQKFLRHVELETAASLEAVCDFTHDNETHSAAMMAGVVKALRWIKTAMTLVQAEPEPETGEEDTFEDPSALPKRKEPK